MMKNVLKITVAVFSLIFLISIIIDIVNIFQDNQNIKLNNIEKHNTEITCFENQLPITINAYIYQEKKDSYVMIYFHNISDDIISAVSIYLFCYNVYGEKYNIDYKNTYDRYIIKPNECQSETLLIPFKTKYVDIVPYNVYFKDNYVQEWGGRNIPKKETLNYAPIFRFEYQY